MKERNITRGYGLLESFLARKRAKMANNLIPQYLTPGKVLDVGCGINLFFLMNAKFKEKYGIDFSLEGSKMFNDKIMLKKIDLAKEDLPFDDNFFDVITMLAVIEHLEPANLKNIFKKIRAILKPDGRFILTTPSPWGGKLLKLLAKIRLVSPKEINEHKCAYGKTAILNCLEKTGFKKENIHFGYFEFFLNSWTYADNK